MKKLSIVAAVYNLEDYLPRCLDSLINQTMQDIEILAVDDGSTDSAPKIIDEYEKKYPEIFKAYHKKNGGEFTTRNYGLERATGEYVTFVDTDDWVEPNWAEKLYDAAKENEADMAVCGFERIDLKTGNVVGTDMVGQGTICKEVDLSKDDFTAFINPAPWNKIYKREKIQDLRFMNFRNFNDTMFLIEAMTRVNKVAFVGEVLYHYYLRYDSQIHNINAQDVQNLKDHLLEVKKFYEENTNYEETKYILDELAFLHLGASVMYRASYDKNIKIRKMTKETKKYLDENFPTWRHNKFMKFGYARKGGIKHIGLWGICLFYKLGLQMVYIRLYRFMIDHLHHDIKW